MSKIPKPIWQLETHCLERYFRRRSRHRFSRIDNSRLKGRVCVRCDDLFLKIAIKRHGRYFSFLNEMHRLRRLRGRAWAPRFMGRIERPRHTIFAYRYYEMTDVKSLLETGPLAPDAKRSLAAQLAGLPAALASEGLVHRDITPANILFDPASGRMLLIDFQWARDVSAEIPVTRPEDEKVLAQCLSVAGGRYRTREATASGAERDRFAVAKIIAELDEAPDPYR